jgi:two-component system, NarL family, nitrate/nitrite response regulator NarL
MGSSSDVTVRLILKRGKVRKMIEQRNCCTVIGGSNVLFREGLIRILSAENFRILCAVACIDRSVLEKLSEYEPALVILDASEDLNAALEQIELIRKMCPTWRVAVLDNNDQLSIAVSVYRAGASAYFVRIANPVTLVKSLELVMLGETIVPATFLPLVLCQEFHDEGDEIHRVAGASAESADAREEFPATEASAAMRQLSPREKTILRYIIEGCSNKVIARKVAISEATVKVHVKSILRKVRVHSRTQAAIWGLSCDAANWAMNVGLPVIEPVLAQSFVQQGALPAVHRTMRAELSLCKLDARKSS